jgi:glyoxylase-like metal-dependent hydrolase (beta-lactamase superfamily II)
MVAGWRAFETPGHTPGHLSLLHEADGVLLAGDVVGSSAGALTRAPRMFTADLAAAEASLRTLAALEVLRLVTSHGDELPDGPERLARLRDAGVSA